MATSAKATVSFTIVPGKSLILDPPADIRFGQAALNDVLVDSSRSALKMTHTNKKLVPKDDEDKENQDEDEDDEEDDGFDIEEEETTVTVAILVPGVVETQLLGGLIVNAGEKVIFEATGKNTIHLSGNVILQDVMDQDPLDDDYDSEMGEEDDEIDYEDDEELDGMTDEDKNA
ncbi:hypothetical protein DL93DRAFT_2105858 [Clavulina sp. PMI_390]|nr:hypothetical protein DL93DRAFT_2105858 [Clavulina sp. PMI_390]